MPVGKSVGKVLEEDENIGMTDIPLTGVIFVLAATPSTGVVLVVNFKLVGHSTGWG